MTPKQISNDVEGQGEDPSFEKKELREHFIRVVYAILTAMLLVDAGCVAAGLYIPAINLFLCENMVLLPFVAASFIVFYGVLVLSEKARRCAPYNYILMAALTLSAGFVMAVSAVKVGQEAVLCAATGTCFVTLSVSIMAFACPCDFTGYALFIFMGVASIIVGSAAFIYASLIGCLQEEGRLFHLGISAAFVFLFALYLAYDTQLVLGGVHHKLQPDEYVHGALHLWIDITLMFLSLFQIAYLGSAGQAQAQPPPTQ